MTLTPGHKLAHYEILEPIGEGGMGEVYRAKDGKLDRDVAIKVLPEEFAKDEERLARFEREAKLLASLNHPNIASIHGFEDSDGVKALILELVEGPTLAERIDQGPIPVEEAIAIAKQIAEALEAGHEASVIHRDLKPANIKLKEDGTVKVLDYGLAKALEGDTAATADSELSQSPTLTRQGTQIGVILGTAAYMSPEQAKGKGVDRRTDIWAFGAVVYEMLTGVRAFEGEDLSDTLAAVLRAEIEWAELPAATPPSVTRLLRRCLNRDPRQRLQHIGDARLELGDVSDEPAGGGAPSPERPLPWLIVAAIAALSLALGGVSTWYLSRTSNDALVRRFTITLDTMSSPLEDRPTPIVTIAPDGQSLIYDDDDQFYRRSFERLEAVPLPGTKGARQAFFSPNGQWIAFSRGGELRKIGVEGGGAVTVTEDVRFSGGSWAGDDIIVFASRDDGALYRVSVDGGEPQKLAANENGGFLWPEVLPHGNAVLASVPPAVVGGEGDEWSVWTISLVGGEPTRLINDGTSARFVPTGHIVFQRGETLFAQRFDLKRLELEGEARPVVNGVLRGAFTTNAPQWDFSGDGTLVYVRSAENQTRTLVWVDRTGQESELSVPIQRYLSPRVSPDGRRIALTITPPAGGGRELWTLALDGGAFTRLTFGSVLSSDPVWSPDGQTVAFGQTVGGSTFDIVTQPSTGIAEPVRRTSYDYSVFPRAWTPDGRIVLIERVDPRSLGSLILGEEDAVQFENKAYEESQPAISPDGRFVAYASTESGRWEIFLRAYPDDGRKWQVSKSGGREPVFSPNGREIFYREADKMMAAGIVTNPEVRAETPSVLFEGRYAADPFGGDSRNYDIAPDGDRFLMIKGSEAEREVVVVLNWFRELERLVPTE